jgi:hypothetical protein
MEGLVNTIMNILNSQKKGISMAIQELQIFKGVASRPT